MRGGGVENAYETTEQVVGTYLGQPLYRRMSASFNLPNTTAKSIAFGVDASKVVNMGGFAYDGSSTILLPNVPTASSPWYVVIYYDGASKSVVVHSGANRSNGVARVWIEYVK